MKKLVIISLLLLSTLFVLRSWDDEAIFTSIKRGEKPNVVVLFDNSGSMNEIIYHPAYVQNNTYSGTFYKGEFDSNNYSETAWHGRLVAGTTAYAPRNSNPKGNGHTVVNDSGTNQIRVSYNLYNTAQTNDWLLGYSSGTVARVQSKTTSGGNYYLNIYNRQGTFQNGEAVWSFQNRSGGVLRAVRLYATNEDGNLTRFQTNYLTWLFLHATDTQRIEVTHQSTYGVFDLNQMPSPTDPALNPSECNCSGQTNVKKTFTRIQTIREVACKVANDNMLKVYLGIYTFRTQDENTPIGFAKGATTGAKALDTIKDMSEGNNLQQYKNKVWQLRATTWTPLAESLADIWYDFLPGPANKNMWPVTSYQPPSTATNQMRNYCQNNYVIIVTDGESTQDKFTDNSATRYNNSIFVNKPCRRTHEPTEPWNYDWGWGDYDTNDPNNHNEPPGYCPGSTCWYSDGTDYLDDVAYFIYHEDLYPDHIYGSSPKNGWPGKQNITTYTIGFNVENHLLRATAENGGGIFYTANNFEELSTKLQAAFNNILLREQEMNFTAFAAPKQSFTYGKLGYIATFIPRMGKTVWEGHLSAYQLDENGDFPADITDKLWDAYNILISKSSSARTIYTAKNNSLIAFNTSTIVPADLAVASDAERDAVVNFIRGDNGYNPNYKLGDIYHFNPQVVGKPLAWKAASDESYKQFYLNNINREEVILAGANDGMLHCFRVTNNISQADELWAFIPPSQLKRLKNLTPVVPAADRPPHFRYFVDGKGIVKDVKIGNQWKTIFIFGMGLGGSHLYNENYGRSYVCLDVTDPTNPSFMWEYTAPEMGYTEARPVIADIYDGTATYPAVFFPGGFYLNYDQEVRADQAANGQGSQFYNERLIGKAVYVVKVENGATIKKFVYGPSVSETVQNGVYIHTNPNFLYAFVASPVIFDRNFDGVADYIYVAETGSYQTNRRGGAIYRINIYGNPATWSPTKIFQDDNGQTIFINPTIGYDANYNLWIMLGTGRRSHIAHRDSQDNFDNTTGHFVAFVDNFNISPAYTTANLANVTSAFINPEPNNNYSFNLTNNIRGFLIEFFRANNEILYEPTPLLINNLIFFNTFSPEDLFDPNAPPDEENVCVENPVSGQQFIYKCSFISSNGGVSITGAVTYAQKILGYGLLSGGKYKLYTGAGVPGSFSISGTETIVLTDIFGPMYWKENKNDTNN